MNKVILIGTNNITMLGAIRTFGVNNIKPYGVFIRDKKGFVETSKYLEKVFAVSSESEIIQLLSDNFKNEQEKPVVITCTDIAAKVIDENLDDLKDKYIVSSFCKKKGEIIKWMDKDNQCLLIDKMRVKRLECSTISLDDIEYQKEVPLEFPVILKPVASIEGKKEDFLICYNQNEYFDAIKYEKKQGHTRILVQRFLEKRKEIIISGAVSQNMISYAIMENIRAFPISGGIGAFSKYLNSEKYHCVAKEILSNLQRLGYSGPIDIDLFEDENGVLYVNEFNWRVSGKCFVCLDTNVHSIYYWYLSVIDRAFEDSLIADKEGYIMCEEPDFFNWLRGNLSYREWKADIKKATSFALYYKHDLNPTIRRYIYIAKTIFLSKLGKCGFLRRIISVFKK